MGRSVSGWAKDSIARLQNRDLRNQIYAVKELVLAQPRPILVYQMAKVGSMSVYRALRAAGLRPLHVHSIIDDISPDTRALHTSVGEPIGTHVLVGRLLSPYLRWTSHRISVISLVRDPVARYISKLYQMPELYPFVRADAVDAARIIAERMEQPEEIDAEVFTWFDREIKHRFEVDVMAEPFDRERGFGTYRGPRADVLVIKTENLTELLPTVVSAFVGAPLQALRANVGQERADGNDYGRVLASLKLADGVASRVYDHAWVRHFYTAQERSAFKERWT